jgi:hypothetical protein
MRTIETRYLVDVIGGGGAACGTRLLTARWGGRLRKSTSRLLRRMNGFGLRPNIIRRRCILVGSGFTAA